MMTAIVEALLYCNRFGIISPYRRVVQKQQINTPLLFALDNIMVKLASCGVSEHTLATFS